VTRGGRGGGKGPRCRRCSLWRGRSCRRLLRDGMSGRQSRVGDEVPSAHDPEPVGSTLLSDLLITERQRAVVEVARRRCELEAVAASSTVEGRDDEHDPDGATVAFEHSLAAGLLTHAVADLAMVDAALGRMSAGTYGRCDDCGDAIPGERLAARPAALTCVECASAREERRPVRVGRTVPSHDAHRVAPGSDSNSPQHERDRRGTS